MRRITTFSVLALIIALLVLPGCGSTGGAATPASLTTPAVNQNPETTPTPVAITGKRIRIFYTNDGIGEIDPCG